MTVWQRWLNHPEKLGIRQLCFQLHLWVGTVLTAYVTMMSLSGSLIVFQTRWTSASTARWIVDLHHNLLAGSTGHLLNGIGAVCLTVLCLSGAIIWWPGRAHWRRSLIVDWSARFPRISWDLHSAVGFWSFLFVLVWGLSGVYFAFPNGFNLLLRLDPADRFTDRGLFWLSELHFGRFGWFAQALWVIAGLVPAFLAFTGMLICCRRVLFKLPSNPKG